MVSMLDDRSLGYSLGAADYLNKPVEHSRLLSVLRKHCPTHSSGRVLLVEDDEATREMIRRVLEKEGWQTAEAENGLVGLERLAEELPAAILLDLMMPVMDGFEFLARLRENKAWQGIPVIVVTAKTLTAADHKRLKGSVEMLVEKGGDEIDTILASLKKMLPAAAAGK
jgi:CheY-like chemotaxis protein